MAIYWQLFFQGLTSWHSHLAVVVAALISIRARFLLGQGKTTGSRTSTILTGCGPGRSRACRTRRRSRSTLTADRRKELSIRRSKDDHYMFLATKPLARL